MDYKQLVFEMYMVEPASKRFKSLFNNRVISELFDFISGDKQVDVMIVSTQNKRPALEGIIEDIEANFPVQALYNIETFHQHRQITGSLVRFIMGHYGYLTDKSKPLRKGLYIKTAITYKKFE